MWRLENDFSKASKAEDPEDEPDEGPSFTDITFDVKHE